MNRLGIIFILSALIVSTVLTLWIYKNQKGKQKTVVEQSNVQILVAAKNLTTGMKLKSSDITWQPWPRNLLSPTFIVHGIRDKKDFEGAVIRSPVSRGQPITDELVIAKGSLSPLTSELRPGMRAFAVNIDLASAIAGLIKPGDRVDIILTYIKGGGGGLEKHFISTTILSNLMVLAVDQELSPVATEKERGRISTTKHVTLEVTPEQVQILALAQSMGELSLSLTTPIDQEAKGDRLQSIDSSYLRGEQSGGEVILFHGEKMEQSGS